MEYEGIDTKTEDPGHPALPIYYMNVSLPLGATNIEVEILNRDILTLSLDYPVIPVQEPATTSLLTKEPDFFWPNEDIYTKDGLYPDNAASVAWTSNISGVSNEATIALYPIVYQPRMNKVELSQSMTVSIKYSIDKKNQNNRATQSRSSIGLPFYEYCIITRDSLIPSFERIIAWKRTKGIDAGAVSIESILSNSYCYEDTVSGISDGAGKIRQYLQYAYQSGKGKYVLLGGNNSILPIRYATLYRNTWYAYGDSIEGKIPADFYFSELNSNWNHDNDIYYGESNYAMSYDPEMFVGRLLCENRKDIENNADKLLRYERNPGNGDFGYLKKAFYCQSDQMQDTCLAQKLIPTCNDVFTTNTILEELPCYDAWNPTFPSGTEIIEAMNNTHYGYLNWMGHGHPLAICTKSDGVRQSDSVYGITPVQTDTVPYTFQEEGHGLDNLNNKDYPAIVYSISCTITPFDSYHYPFNTHPNIGESFTMGKDYGGPALIGNTRVGLIYYSYRLQMLFNGNIKNNSLGEALCYAKRDYNSSYKRLMIFTTNLIGCPELHMWTNIPNYFGNIVKTDSSTSDTNLSFTAYSDTVEVAVRDVWGNDDVALYTFHPSYSNLTIPNSQGKLITLKALNHIPEILHMENGSAIVHGRRYVYASSATLGGEVNSTFTVDNDADITIEKTGVLRLSSGFKVKQGARFVVR
ncbi:MAG: hypothetical protein IKX25_05350 [Bacteroidales bacterium]|nr:hypothetical protein [Bacteroidales bacterium]